MRIRVNVVVSAALAVVLAGAASAQVVLVESGHYLKKIADSLAPVHGSQIVLETACGFGSNGIIEGIGMDNASGTLYVQIVSTSWTDSCIFAISPQGITTVVNPSTGFDFLDGGRGTDLIYDPASGLLITKDDNGGSPRLATVHPISGAVGTFTTLPVTFSGATFGGGFSAGVGGTDVPAGQLVFTGDVAASGLYSAPLGGPAVLHNVTPSGGDDMVVQPDGDWVWIGDSGAPIINYSPAGPDPHSSTTTALNHVTMFANASLIASCGTRSAVCDLTGNVYVSYSCLFGGSAIFRVDEALTTATLLLTIGQPPGATQGLQDMIVGPPSRGGASRSLYFTVHDTPSGGEQVWEVTLPESGPAIGVPIPALSPLGMVAAATLLLGVGFLAIRRRLL